MLARLQRLGLPLLILALDLVAVATAHFLAYGLRFDGAPQAPYRDGMLRSLPLLAACTIAGLAWCGAYRIDLRFTGPDEIVRIAKSIALVWAAYVQILFMLGLPGVPRSVVLMDGGLVFLLTVSLRLAPRLRLQVWCRAALGRRVLVYGAGNAGEMIVREMLRQPELGYRPVGFVDDCQGKWESEIHGLRVHGGSEDLARFVRRYRVEEVIIAAPAATGAEMRRMVERCHLAGVPYRTLPGLREILDGRAQVRSVREVRIEDLLGRDPVRIDIREVRAFLAGKRVLVTGAAGSIGSELCRHILAYEPQKLLLLDRNENGIFHLERQLQESAPAGALEVALCDVTDAARVQRVVSDAAPHVVFHAAAYKHVPLMERHPTEAVRNNVFGTLHLAAAAERCGVHSFVLISTDKAVAPSSVMGATKRVAGMLIQDRARTSRTRFMTVRFGNVLGSEGSVLQVFRQQIASGGPVTVTSPHMRRFFMTIPEAVQLISQAATMGRGGEIFILEMGEPVSIDEMARHVIRLSGLEPDRDIEVKYTGPRPGEKLEERLWNDSEQPERTIHPQILSAQCRPPDGRALRAGLKRLRLAVASGDDAAIITGLCSLVPDYRPARAAGDAGAGSETSEHEGLSGAA